VPYTAMSRHHRQPLLCSESRYSALDRMIASNITAAREYLRPEKVRGGMSVSPYLIITHEDDQRTVTRTASVTATA